MVNASERIIVALDMSAQEARELALSLKGKAQWLKVGMTLYYSKGPGIVAEFKRMGYQVFVDLKLHDIPHQVRGAARAVAAAGADMLTVHASGGLPMMQAAVEGATKGALSLSGADGDAQSTGKPLCLAITVLTSMDDAALDSIGVEADAATQVERLALLAKEAGMDGVVCSPQETEAIRQGMGSDFAIVTPGVRPAGSKVGDQMRVATPASALKAGASYLVIGRPVTEAANPLAAFEAIVEEMSL